MINKLVFLSVDLQKDFSAPGGKHYRPHSNVAFIKQTLLPFLATKGIKIAEIVSDYRQPRPGDRDESCWPGKVGYESEIPLAAKQNPVWVKCMNSPIWVRQGGGDPGAKPGLPYQDTAAFSKWLESTIGKPEDVEAVILMGLTIDCCVLCTAQELTFRGYKVNVLAEAVDVYSGDPAEKQAVLASPILRNWAKVVNWDTLKQKF
jgi:nicotinamidase-related amidase